MLNFLGDNKDTFWGPNVSCDALINDANMPAVLQTPTNKAAYIVLSILHIVGIQVPAFLISVMTLYLLSKLTYHPCKVILRWMCVFSAVSPSSYAFLMDLSLIFDQPIIGHCERKWEGAIYWLLHSQIETSLLWIFTFNVIIFYASIHYNTLHFSIAKINGIIIGIISAASLESMLWVFLTEYYGAINCKIRGSFCVTIFSGNPAVLMTLEYVRTLLAVVPIVIVVPLCMYLYWRNARNGTVELKKPLVQLIVALSVGTFLWNAPTVILHFATYYGERRTFISFFTTYMLQLNHCLYPIIIATLHRDMRENLTKILTCNCFWSQRRLQELLLPQEVED